MGAKNWKVHRHVVDLKQLIEGNKNQRFIYLSPDAEKELDSIDENAVYIIGGLVDRQVIKFMSSNKASILGIES